MDIKELTNRVIAFRDARDWSQFNNPKDTALSLVLESTEVLEHFQWKNGKEIDEYIKNNKKQIEKELADVLYWVLLMSKDMAIDISNSLIEKISENEKKYPVDKFKGIAKKYNK